MHILLPYVCQRKGLKKTLADCLQTEPRYLILEIYKKCTVFTIFLRLSANELRPCKFCGKVFQSRSDLRLHSCSEIPFICTVCNKKFARSAYLARHMKLHHGDVNIEAVKQENSSNVQQENGNREKKTNGAKRRSMFIYIFSRWTFSDHALHFFQKETEWVSAKFATKNSIAWVRSSNTNSLIQIWNCNAPHVANNVWMKNPTNRIFSVMNRTKTINRWTMEK